MPLPQASLYDGIGFGKAVDHVAGNHCQKRKLALNVGDFDQDMEQECDQQPWFTEASVPKRQCLWSSSEPLYPKPIQSHNHLMTQDSETLPGCLKNVSPAMTFSSSFSCPVSSSSFTSGHHQQSMGVTSDVAAAVSFSSAAMTSSVFPHLAMSSSSSILTSSSAESQASRSPPPPPSLADLFKSRLRQRQLEQAQGGGPSSVCDNNANCLTQDINHMTDIGMTEACGKEANNNNYNNNNNNNGFVDSSHQKACTDPSEETMDGQMAMDSDFVPDMAQYAPGPATPTPSSAASLSEPVSTPQRNHLCSDERRCGFFTCSGLRPSPVTGRLHCLCSASWRGMYGMEAAYMTDYY